MNQPQMAPQAAPQMEPPKKGVGAWLWIVLVIVVLGAAGYFGWYYFGDKLFGGSTPTSTTDNTPTDPTANWKAYTDTNYNFSIKYPDAWSYKLNNSVIEFRETGKTYDIEGSDIYAIGISVTDNTDNKTLSELATSDEETTKAIDVTLGSKDAKKITNHLMTRVISLSNNKIYSLSAPNLGSDTLNKPILDIFNKMISTFKFTTASTGTDVSTADWKTYNENGFIFKYPKDWVVSLPGEKEKLNGPESQVKLTSPEGSFFRLLHPKPEIGYEGWTISEDNTKDITSSSGLIFHRGYASGNSEGLTYLYLAISKGEFKDTVQLYGMPDKLTSETINILDNILATIELS